MVSIGLKRDISAISDQISIGIRANVQVTVAPKPRATVMAATAMMIPMDMIDYLCHKIMVPVRRAIFDLNHFLRLEVRQIFLSQTAHFLPRHATGSGD
jgi:hypothetical protein